MTGSLQRMCSQLHCTKALGEKQHEHYQVSWPYWLNSAHAPNGSQFFVRPLMHGDLPWWPRQPLAHCTGKWVGKKK